MKKLKNYSESEALSIIDDVSCRVAKNFSFGYYDVEDIEQEARILSIKAIDEGKYDEGRPLRNFLFVYLKSRLINLKRDKYFRHTLPCVNCPLYDPHLKCSKNGCSQFDDKMECESYNMWYHLNHSKRGLLEAIDIESVNIDNERHMSENGYLAETEEKNELADYIDIKLPISMRQDYLKLISNFGVRKGGQAKLSGARISEIRIMVSGIVEEYYART